MSLFDEFGALVGELFSEFELPTITITRTTLTRTTADRAAGRKGTSSALTLTGRGKIGTRKLKLDDGTIHQEATIMSDVELRENDAVGIGLRSFNVLAVEEVAPTGLTPMLWLATVK